MKKLVNMKKTNEGMTLVELVVTLMISALLMGTIGSVFFLSQKVHDRGEAISFKQGSITNLEVKLQNALSKATSVTLKDKPDGDYNLGFNAEGNCVEVLRGENLEYMNYEVTGIELHASQKANLDEKDAYVMEYKLFPKDNTMSVLSAGIAMNNIIKNQRNSLYEEKVFGETPVVLDSKEIKYLVINFGAVIDYTPKTLYDRVMNTIASKVSEGSGFKLPDDWKELSENYPPPKDWNNGWIGNDTIRLYVRSKYYEGSWPTVPKETIALPANINLKKYADEKSGELYIQAFALTDLSDCIIYAKNDLGDRSWYGIRLFYDPEKDVWYWNKTGSKGFSLNLYEGWKYNRDTNILNADGSLKGDWMVLEQK